MLALWDQELPREPVPPGWGRAEVNVARVRARRASVYFIVAVGG